MAYDFKRLVYGALMFTATMYVLLLIVGGLGTNYGKDMTQLGGEIFDEDTWVVGTTTAFEDAGSIRNTSITSSVTNLDEPTSSKSVFEQITDFVLLPVGLLFNVLSIVFDVPGPVMFIFGTILIIELILIVWRLLKVGD